VISVLLVDDQAVVRGGLRSMLRVEPDISVVGEAASGEEAIELASALHPDIILLDVRMPGMDGLATLPHLKARSPRSSVIMVTQTSRTAGRTGRANSGSSVSIPVAMWASMGLAMFVIRCFETQLTGGSTGGEPSYDWVMAIFMLLLYGLSGWCLYEAAQTYFSSSYHLVRPTQKKAATTSYAADKAAGLALHVVEGLDTNRIAASQWANEYRMHRIRLANDQARIKDSVRLALAAHLKNPSETSLVLEPHRASNVPE